MKKTMLASLLLALTVSLSTAAGEGWMTDFEAAKQKAAAENKDLLVDFTGSDWCGWCIKLVDEVFKHDVFKQGAADNFVLVELDFPQDKSKLDEATQKQNEMLQKKYSIQGFPPFYYSTTKVDPMLRPATKLAAPRNTLPISTDCSP